jgi:hypothetical protein
VTPLDRWGLLPASRYDQSRDCQLYPALALMRWLLICWHRPGAEGNELLEAALPGSPGLHTSGNWPLSADCDNALRDLVKAGWIEQRQWCPDLSMARYVAPGAPTTVKDEDGIGFYAAGYYYHPRQECEAYELTIRDYAWLLRTLPRFGEIGPGDNVKLTPAFLASTGQTKSAEARKRWTVKPCGCNLCKLGRCVAVDEDRAADYSGDPEYQEHIEKYPWRHINARNLRRLS